MKYLFITLMILSSCTSATEDDKDSEVIYSLDDSDSLSKYSYFVYGGINFIDTLDKNRGAIVQGTGFFIANNNNLYFITAKHVLAVPNEPAIKKVTPKSNDSLMNIYMEDGSERANMPIFYLNVKKIRDTTKDVTFVFSPDVISYKVTDSEHLHINDINQFIPSYLPKRMGDICIFGFASSGNSFEGAKFAANPKSKVLIKKYSFGYKNEYEKSKIDYFDYVVTPTDYKVTESLHGYSGSPAFVKDLDTNKWVFLGITAGVHPDFNLMFFVKPEFIKTE